MGRGSSKAGGGGGGKANGHMDQILDKLNGNEPWTKADKSALNSAIKNAAVGDSLIYTGSGGSETYIKGPNGWEHVGVVDSPNDTSTMSMTMVTMAGYQDSGGNSWSYKPARSTKQPTAKATTSTAPLKMKVTNRADVNKFFDSPQGTVITIKDNYGQYIGTYTKGAGNTWVGSQTKSSYYPTPKTVKQKAGMLNQIVGMQISIRKPKKK